MPRIPIFTADEPQPIPRSPDYIYNPSTGYEHVIEGASRLAKSVSGASADIASANFKIQDQQDEQVGTVRAAKWLANEKDIKRSLLNPDPSLNDSTTVPATQDIEGLYKDRMIQMTKDLSGDLSRGAKFYFFNHVNVATPGKLVELRDDVRRLSVAHAQAGLEDLANVSHDTAIVAPTETERNNIVTGYTNALARAEARNIITPQQRVERERAFSQSVLEGRGSVLIKNNDTRQLFWQMNDRGDFDSLDPVRHQNLEWHAGMLDQRQEAHARVAEEKQIKDAQDILQTDIMKVAGKNPLEASRQLDDAETHHELPAHVIRTMREWLSKPAPTMPSDPAVAQRVGLDVMSSNPKTTQSEIDKMVTSGQLSFDQGMQFKGHLVERQKMQFDLSKSDSRYRQSQAEQNLKAMINWHPDMIGALENKIEGDPRPFMYEQYLRDLTQRSNAFTGKEDPLAVVESFRPEIQKKMSDFGMSLKPDQIQKMYPDLQSLEQAVRRGELTKDQLDQQRSLRPAPGAAPPKRAR